MKVVILLVCLIAIAVAHHEPGHKGDKDDKHAHGTHAVEKPVEVVKEAHKEAHKEAVKEAPKEAPKHSVPAAPVEADKSKDHKDNKDHAHKH